MLSKPNFPSVRTNTKTSLTTSGGHYVQFYSSDSKLVAQLATFIGEGLQSAQTCIIIATPSHRRKLHELLIKKGVDVLAAEQDGQYVVLDAAETLDKFMENELPNRTAFYNVVGDVVKKAARTGRPIRAYGEMVALLWKDGNKEGVLQLENLWNELASSYLFTLFCAYPELHFILDRAVRNEITACHTMARPLSFSY